MDFTNHIDAISTILILYVRDIPFCVLKGQRYRVQLGMCLQQRFKPVCASTQSNQGLSFLTEETLNPQDYWMTLDFANA